MKEKEEKKLKIKKIPNQVTIIIRERGITDYWKDLKATAEGWAGQLVSYLIFFVLSSVWEAWNHSSNSRCRSNFASVNHNQKFHQVIVDFTRARLNNVNIFPSNWFPDFDAKKKTDILENIISQIYISCWKKRRWFLFLSFKTLIHKCLRCHKNSDFMLLFMSEHEQFVDEVKNTL